MREAIVSEKMRLAQAIDHTKLTFEADENRISAIENLCAEAVQAGFFAVCIRLDHVRLCRQFLKKSPVRVACVIGFPVVKVSLADELKNPTIGNFTTDDKLSEIQAALANGADELDLVMNMAAFKNDVRTGGGAVLSEFEAVRRMASQALIKVIIEIDLLTADEIVQATKWCANSGMDMVKTSTGMVSGGTGATLEAVCLIGKTLAEMQAPLGIKASGGIRTREQALAFLQNRVSRIGTSAGLSILEINRPDIGNSY